MSWSIKYSFALTKKFFITEFDCKINKVKSSVFSDDHRGARKMNLFYYRGCVNHNLKVAP